MRSDSDLIFRTLLGFDRPVASDTCEYVEVKDKNNGSEDIGILTVPTFGRLAGGPPRSANETGRYHGRPKKYAFRQ